MYDIPYVHEHQPAENLYLAKWDILRHQSIKNNEYTCSPGVKGVLGVATLNNLLSKVTEVANVLHSKTLCKYLYVFFGKC